MGTDVIAGFHCLLSLPRVHCLSYVTLQFPAVNHSYIHEFQLPYLAPGVLPMLIQYISKNKQISFEAENQNKK
jgi:hypothetical protein